MRAADSSCRNSTAPQDLSVGWSDNSAVVKASAAAADDTRLLQHRQNHLSETIKQENYAK